MLSNGSCWQPERARRASQRPPSKMDSDTGIDCVRCQMRFNKRSPDCEAQYLPLDAARMQLRELGSKSRHRQLVPNEFGSGRLPQKMRQRAFSFSFQTFATSDSLRLTWSHNLCATPVRIADKCAPARCIVANVTAPFAHTGSWSMRPATGRLSFDCHAGARRTRRHRAAAAAQCDRSRRHRRRRPAGPAQSRTRIWCTRSRAIASSTVNFSGSTANVFRPLNFSPCIFAARTVLHSWKLFPRSHRRTVAFGVVSP